MPAAALTAADLPFAVPGVWHADALGAAMLRTQPSGHAALDAHLPGGGWPLGALSEVLQSRPGLLEWALVLPALAQATAARAGAVVLVAPPCEPFGPALQAQGLAAERLCVVRAAEPQAALWSAEQALRCRDVLAVLAWLPQAPPQALRRLQLAAAPLQPLAWVFRGTNAAPQASPAPLRLQAEHAGVSGMQVRILKRRGAPLAQALHLPGSTALLTQALAAQAGRQRAAQQAAAPAAPSENGHALARTALALAR